jgi:putative drug exporter of the RND superfamily
MSSLARWCYRRRFTVLGLWVAALIVLGGLSQAAGDQYTDQFSLPGTESTRALQLLERSFPTQSGDSEKIVWAVKSGTVNDAQTRERVGSMLAKVAKLPHVVDVASPYSKAGAGQVSRDGKIAFASVNYDKQVQDVPKESFTTLIDTAQAARTDGLQVELGGNGIQQAQQQQQGSTEFIGIALAAVVLFIAFGSLFATLLPLLSAIFALGAGLAAAGLIAGVIDIATFAPQLATLIGLGVGIDYALFIVTRHRNAIMAGKTPEEAVQLALDTSGRAVLFAGTTVCIALLGLLILGVSFLNGVAVAAVISVLFTMLAATTLLPALLGVIRMKVLSRKERRRLAEEGPHDTHATGAWARWSAYIQRYPTRLAIAATAVMLLLAVPFLSLRLGSSDAGNDPTSTTTRQAYDLLAKAFGPGSNGQIQLVANTPRGKVSSATLDKLTTAVKGNREVVSVSPPVPNKDGSVAIVNVVPRHAPQDKETSDLIAQLRSDIVPRAVAGSDVKVYVGGITAIFDDFAEVLTGKLPLFIGVIILLGCLLLMIAFRSIVVPLTAAVMNLLAAGAAFGVVTAVFQWGWGSGLIEIGRAGPVEAFLPVMMLAILFGLSMDYQVFLVSRMHEEWGRTHDNAEAVRVGQADTGRVITAAAGIMVLIFGSFTLLGQRVISEFGIGLGGAVLLDAFILRTVLVPALMHRIGPANWWLPRRLDRALPHVSVDPSEAELSRAPA